MKKYAFAFLMACGLLALGAASTGCDQDGCGDAAELAPCPRVEAVCDVDDTPTWICGKDYRWHEYGYYDGFGG